MLLELLGYVNYIFLNYTFKELKKYARKQEDKIKRYIIILNAEPF